MNLTVTQVTTVIQSKIMFVTLTVTSIAIEILTLTETPMNSESDFEPSLILTAIFTMTLM